MGRGYERWHEEAGLRVCPAVQVVARDRKSVMAGFSAQGTACE